MKGQAVLLTVRDVARVLAVPENTVEHWASQSALPAMRFGGQYRFNRIELLEWATIRQIPLDPEVFHLGGDESGVVPGLRAALERGGIDRSDAEYSQAVVEQVDRLPLPATIDREELRLLLRSRSAAARSLVAGSIVVPHPRYPIVAPVPEPLLRLCYLDPARARRGDSKPAIDAFFLLVSPTVKSHLTLLAVLAGALSDVRFVDAVKQQLPSESLLAEAGRFNGERRPI